LLPPPTSPPPPPFFFTPPRPPPPLPSFPTRRSSDLRSPIPLRRGPRMIVQAAAERHRGDNGEVGDGDELTHGHLGVLHRQFDLQDRKSTRLNSSHVSISYAVFCLKKKKQ